MNSRIRELRKALKLSQEEFGSRLGVGKSAISYLESGRSNVTEQMILLICKEFSANEDWLRSGEGEMFEQLTEQQKVLKYTAMLLKDTDSVVVDAIKNLIITYEQLDDPSKRVLEQIALKYIENMKK
ncbi:DNA-binding transcriptional regulator, XRE-family HTH domain [Lacrimispora sphenoides]|uniref:helix-turn-helix domain-containing protein n=1 Tax=Lacrimispora sphenoides TaxID=29370 RepID=UPI0008B7909E|nr:helix-turn-helix transcriptional regulator [Lacrimispora sphenoides]SEU24103.1 DNA-binding transcriptional regulator, XRE-family HTH domain [Lacrimispora sphenoides]